jgi:hypothetical protein
MSHKANYNIVLNSQFCTSATSANVNTNKEYYVDWSAILPNKKFKLTFSFVSEGCYITTFGLMPLITIDFLNQGNISICNQSFQATTSTILGLTYPTYLDPNAHIAYFRADKDFNNQIYTPRPFSNNFNVRIITNGNPPALWLDEAVVPADFPQYVLILSFEECE